MSKKQSKDLHTFAMSDPKTQADKKAKFQNSIKFNKSAAKAYKTKVKNNKKK